MMIPKKYYYLCLLLVSITLISSCENDDNDIIIVDDIPVSAGSADFSNFVSVGNSLTAGFTDGALFIIGQENSLPNLLSQKFVLAGVSVFS